jgi:hypothetical protein
MHILTSERIVMSQRHPFPTVSCFRRFVSRDKICHYLDRFICQTMIRTFCILKKMTVDAFHYLTLSVRCEELDAHIN